MCSKTKIGICLQNFSTEQRFQKQIFCVSKLKMIVKVVFISKTSLRFFEKTLTIAFEETHFLERGCLEEGGVCKFFLLLWETFIRGRR